MKLPVAVDDAAGRGPRAVTRREPRTPALEAQAIDQDFSTPDGRLAVLRDVNLAAAPGEFVVIIGPSGCGKSTLFNILVGLDSPVAGEVLIDGEVTDARLGRTAYMPQKDLLLPWKTVLDNTIIGLELQGVSRKAAREISRTWFPRFGLAGFERYYPAKLSGGMRQRAALLRTFLAGRDILLLDEPFGALDALTRADMQEWLLEVWTSFAKTVVLVTHDVDEAIFLADRVYVMTPRPGRIAAVVDIGLTRPRQYDRDVTSGTFAALKAELLGLLRHPREEDGFSS